MTNEEFISQNSNCRVGGSKNDVIYLPVTISGLPKTIEIKGNILYLKNEFHVSLVCVNVIQEKYNFNITDFLNKVVSDFSEFIKNNNIELLHFNNDFKFAEENDLKSVIVTCEVLNINKFYDFINSKYGLNLEYPPTHVTLYALENGIGIYLVNSNDIKSLTAPIENPIGHEL